MPSDTRYTAFWHDDDSISEFGFEPDNVKTRIFDEEREATDYAKRKAFKAGTQNWCRVDKEEIENVKYDLWRIVWIKDYLRNNNKWKLENTEK